PLLYLSSRQRDPRVFSGVGDEDVEEWVDFYARVSLHNKWDDPTKLATVVFYLSDIAKTWFLTHEAEMTSWQAFSSRVHEVFGRPEDRKAAARRRLNIRTQLPTEGYTSYIEDILTLCRKVSADMPEADRVRHVLKGIAEEAVHLFVLQPPADVNSIRTLCQSLEAARRQRISSTETSLPSSSTLSFLPQVDQLHQIIRTVVREELARYFGASLPSVNNSPTADFRSIIRDELNQVAPRSFTAPPSPAPQPPTYAEMVRRQPPSPPIATQPSSQISPVAAFTSTNYQRPPSSTSYRTPGNRPVCYYCGIPGHVARFCRRRRADENENWHSRASYGGPRNYQYPQTFPKSYYSSRDNSDEFSPPDYPPRSARPRSPSPHRRPRSVSPMIPGPRRSSLRSEN
ncbi:unnamed protein product, partial [Ixodes hexagonus]